MAKLLLLAAVANSVTTPVHMATVMVLSMDVTLHCGTKAEEIHGVILQRFPVGSSLNTLKNFALLVRLIAFVFTFTSQLWTWTIHNASSSMSEGAKGQDLSFSHSLVAPHQY